MQNLIYANHAVMERDYLLPPLGTAGSIMFLIPSWTTPGAKAIGRFPGGFDDASQIINNLFVSNTVSMRWIVTEPTTKFFPFSPTTIAIGPEGSLEGTCANVRAKRQSLI